MWTEALINTLACFNPDFLTWHSCPVCRVQHQGRIRARDCEKSHSRSYERKYANITKQVTHTVSFVDGKPYCGGCVSRGKFEGEVISTVQSANPPNCVKCEQPIQDAPRAEIKPPRLSLSERLNNARFELSRRHLITEAKRSLHRSMKGLGNSVHERVTDLESMTPEERRSYLSAEQIDREVFVQVGPYKPDGNEALPRFYNGYARACPEEQKRAES